MTRSPFGHLFAFARDPLSFLIDLNQQYGDLAHFKIRKRSVFLVNHPDDIEGILVSHARNFVKNPGFQTIKRVLGEGLLSSEGDFHLRQRRMIQPAFHRHTVAAYAPGMVEQVQKISDRWQSGAETNAFREMVALTLNVVGHSLFGADVDAQTGEISQAIDNAMTLFHQATSAFSLLLTRIPGIGDRRFRSGRAQLDATILRLIQQRRAEVQPREDLLSRLIQAQDEGDGGQMTDTQVRNEALTLLLAGHETTATGLAWAWYLLSQHPAVEDALHEEIDAVLQGRLPDIDDVGRLVFTRMVFTEALRLYPPVYMLGRQALQDYPLRGTVIPAGASIIISPYLVHHHPEFYPDPERFDPLRWSQTSHQERHKYAYIPFGAGPRVCVGEPFAWQEAVLVLATLARRWRLVCLEKPPVQMLPRVTLRPKGGISMLIKERAL